MKVGKIVKAAVLLASATMLSAAAGSSTTRTNWDTVVAKTELGHRIGNPDAKTRLVEFISYTCPHCAEFTRQSEAPIKQSYLAPGRVNVEIRHMVRDPVDLTVGLLVNCGETAKFPGNHSAFLVRQPQWIEPLGKVSSSQRQRWTTEGAAGRRAIASDFGFYAIMERRGYRRADIDRCLADDALARRLAEISAKEWARPGISGTPSFSINGVVMPGTHSWARSSASSRNFSNPTRLRRGHSCGNSCPALLQAIPFG